MKAILFLLLLSTNVVGQDESWKYFGQTPLGKSAQLFAPELIKHLAHSSPTFSPDGKEMYWSTVSGENETRKIYCVRYENGAWSEKMLAPFSGQFHDDQPFLSYNGQKMFFASKRTPKEDGTLELDIWTVDRKGKDWGIPQAIDNEVGFWTPSVTRSGSIYFLGKLNGVFGICRSDYKDGNYSDTEFLPDQINQKDARNWCPFIAPDESYLIFSSDREGGYGNGDLYISFRKDNGEWGEAINMGDTVNTSYQERFPGVSPDGKYLFFTRWCGPSFYHDLYWMDAGFIEGLMGKNNL